MVVADRRKTPPLQSWKSDSPISFLISKSVCQKLVLAGYLRPPGSSSVPPLPHLLFLNTARGGCFPQARTTVLLRQKPTRSNVQQPSALSAVACELNELGKRNTAASSSPARSSYSILSALGCDHFNSRPPNSEILLT